MIPSVYTARRLSAGEQRTIERLRREAEQLGDRDLAAGCERALAGSANDAEDALAAALELHGQLC